MKVKDLIKELQQYPEDLNIDCNDGHGIYSDIKGVKRQSWSDRSGNDYDTVTIIHYGYDKNNAKISEAVIEKDKQQETPVEPEESASKPVITYKDWKEKVADKQLEEQPTPEPTSTLKVGDYVKIIACTNKDTEKIYLNRVGKITDIWPGNRFGEYCVTLPNGCNSCFFGNQIEPVASTYE